MTDEKMLAELTLDAHEWRGIQELSNALDSFEPLAKRGNLGPVVADRLVSLELAEKENCDVRYATFGDGYRLTELGWKILDRGRFPKRRS